MFPWSRMRRMLTGALAAVTAGQLAVVAGAASSPWLVSRFIRIAFDRDNRRVAARMRPHVPTGGSRRVDIGYRPNDADALLDLFRSAPASDPVPVVVWVHGGGWLSGKKSDVAPYLQILCAENGGPPFAAVGLDYTRGPEGRYPLALHQIDSAVGYLIDHAGELGTDAGRIVLAGDSAGAQLAGQYAAMVTNPAFADQVGLRPRLTAEQLRGVVLHCGVYDMDAFRRLPPAVLWAYRRMVWAWTGTLDIDHNKALQQMSSLHVVTADFPPALISGGNGDPLTDSQSRPFVGRLRELGVPTTAHFYPPEHLPSLAHQFQFDLDGADGPAILRHTVDFLAERFA